MNSPFKKKVGNSAVPFRINKYCAVTKTVREATEIKNMACAYILTFLSLIPSHRNPGFEIRVYWFKRVLLIDGDDYVNIHFHRDPADHGIAKVSHISGRL